MKLDLNGFWQGTCYDTDGKETFCFDGKVPGCVHTDLAGTKLPADLYYRDNADLCQWVEERDWAYCRSFCLEEVPENSQLVFEGLDVYADVYLNGKLLGSTDNMFIPHRFDVTQVLRRGENTLRVYFHSPIRRVAGLPPRKAAFGTFERIYTRRVQCTYGWDWVARFVTCGIWRDVYLEATSGFGLKDVYIYTESISCGSAQIVVEAEFENYEQGGIAELEILDPQGIRVYRQNWFCREPQLKAYIDLPNAKLWYPAGYGDQPLYILRLCGKETTFGIRTVSIRQLPDAPGSDYYDLCLAIKDSESGRKYDHNEEFSGFLLLVNDVPVLCKGANWVPCEPFPSAESEDKITQLLTLAREAGVNMLRVWGGGIFEKQHFYDQCDRLGLLVTQDFLMACGHYPEEDQSFLDALGKETAFAALALRNHPCLMWWSGDNENAVLGSDTAEDYRGRTAIHRGIGPVLERLDPRRRFLPSSPCGGNTYASKTVGTTHNTQFLGQDIFPYIMNGDMADYKAHFSQLLARFIAEEPTCGAACLPSLRRFMTDADIFDSDDMWQYHTKSNPSLSFTLFDMQQHFAEKVLGAFADGHDRFFKLKYGQFEWVRVSMENVRRHRGFINGIIYWMWNDCWPASSGWSFVDYYCLPKASFYSFKRCAGEMLISIDRQAGYDIYLCNDSLEAKEVALSVKYILSGRCVALQDICCTVDPACSEKVLTLPLTMLPEGAVLVCDGACGQWKDRAFYREGSLPLVPCEVHTERTENAFTVWSDTYVHAVELEGEFVFTDNYFSLLPGEKRTVACRSAFGTEGGKVTVTAYTMEEQQ